MKLLSSYHSLGHGNESRELKPSLEAIIRWLRTQLFPRLSFYLAIYLLLIGGLYVFQEKLLFFPSDELFESCSQSDGLRSVTRNASDPNRAPVRYHFIPHTKARANVFVYHGNAGSACDRIFYREEFSDLPMNWILVEYPGYAGDGTTITQDTVLSNALETFDSAKEPEMKGLPSLILGESLGSGVATYVASRRATAALILISPYTSIEDVAASTFWFLPVRLLIRDRYPATEWAATVRTPVLVLHGANDNVINVGIGKKQSQSFPVPAKYVELPNSGHNDWLIADRDLAESTITAFLDEALAASSSHN